MDMKERVRKVVANQLGIGDDEVKDDSKFAEDLGADSLDGVELMMAMEDEFGVEIPDAAAEKMTTPALIAEWLMGHGAKE